MSLITVPLNCLQLSPRNVRKTGGASIDDLAASIRAHGLHQNLGVTKTNGEGYAVEFGGRRLKAMLQLAAAGELAADFPVDCRLLTDTDALEASLAENQLREAMHPADQFLAFKALVDDGKTESEIGARFGVPRLFVRQRMKLAKVSPKIIEDYRAGKTTLDVVEACALTDDVPRQERAYKQNRHWADGIRRALTQGEIESTDKRVKFVGLDAYEAAGGPVHKDLFAEEDTCYLRDAALLDRLVAEKLEAEAEKVRAEGWGWVEAALNVNAWNYPKHYDRKGDKSKFGALVEVAHNGKIEIHPWCMKPGQRAGKTAQAKKPVKRGDDLSQDMVWRLELHRAAAIREAVAANPQTALRMLLHDMLSHLFHVVHGNPTGNFDGGIQADNRHASDGGLISGKFADLKKSPARSALAERVKRWEDALKANGKKPTMDWLATLNIEQQHELLALCFALTLERNAGKEGTALADALGIDMTQWWTASADTFFNVVPKPALAAAVSDVAGKIAGEQLLTMKKDAAIAAAAKHLDGKGWLPKPLRGARYDSTTGKSAKKAGKKTAKKVSPQKPAKKAGTKSSPKKTATSSTAKGKSR